MPICIAPATLPAMHEAMMAAARRGGAEIVPIEDATGLVWADPFHTETFADVYAAGTNLQWVQLPFAGVGPFVPHLDERVVWTCGKGVYARPVAEHVVTLALAGLRDLHRFIPVRTWGERTGRNLIGATVTILGGGGIAESLIELLQPFRCTINVVRRTAQPLTGVDRVLTQAELAEVLPATDVLVVAWALTPETDGAVDSAVFAALPEHAWLVNVGRGAHVNHEDLVAALQSGAIGGAALDVTEPEPLPDEHPLWQQSNCIITPHVGNTAEMGLPLLAGRIEENVRLFLAGEKLVGQVDVAAGY